VKKDTGDSTMKVEQNQYFIEEEYPMAHTNYTPYLPKNVLEFMTHFVF